MNTNVLLQHVDPGQVCWHVIVCWYAPMHGFHSSLALQIKRTTFQRPPEEKVFGVPRPLDPEGAREGTACPAGITCKLVDVSMNKLLNPGCCCLHSDWYLEAAQAKPFQPART